MKKIISTFMLIFVLIGIAGCFEPSLKLEEIKVTSSASEAEAGDTLTLSYQLVPGSATGFTVTWVIEDGSEFATIEEDNLVIKEEAPVNAEIVVKAVCDTIESNSLTIKIVRPLNHLSIGASSNVIEAGESLDLTATCEPSDATGVNVEWIIVEGDDFAFVDSVKNQLFARSSAVPGAIIKIKARSGNIESDVLNVTVHDPKTTELHLLMQYDELIIDRNDIGKVLPVRVFNGNLEQLFDTEVTFEVIEGADVLEIKPDGQTCELVAKGHGDAIVKATITGSEISATSKVHVIVPPVALKLPEVFDERSDYMYSFGQSYELPFAVSLVKDVEKVCDQLKYTFAKKGSVAPSTEIGAYENGKITFLTTGEITVTATSDSGSKVEAKTSYTFNVNDGLNVYTFEELKTAVESNQGAAKINIVVLEKIVSDNDKYGYDLVPDHIAAFLNNGVAQGFDEVQNTIISGNGSYEIIGNNHRINLEDQRYLTSDEYDDYYLRTGISVNNIDDLLQFRALPGVFDYKVLIRDLEIKGNCGIDYTGSFSGENPKPNGVQRYAINLNKNLAYPYENIITPLQTKIENVIITNFSSGLSISNAYFGEVSKVTVSNLFGTGIAVKASSLTFNNMTFGPCGASSLELIGANSHAAPSAPGANATFDQPQQIRLIGQFNCTNLNDGNTIYLQNYQKTLLQGTTVVDLIGLNLQSNLPAMNNVMNPAGEILFGALLFNELTELGTVTNETVLTNDWGENAIVNYKDMSAGDTTHKYVLVPLIVPLGGTVYDMGYVLCFNLNYLEE
jgi:hypothetical protein